MSPHDAKITTKQQSRSPGLGEEEREKGTHSAPGCSQLCYGKSLCSKVSHVRQRRMEAPRPHSVCRILVLALSWEVRGHAHSLYLACHVNRRVLFLCMCDYMLLTLCMGWGNNVKSHIILLTYKHS